MIIQIAASPRLQIEGVATEASVTVKGDTATVGVAIGAMIAMPRPGQIIGLFDQQWQVVRTLTRTAQVIEFTCRRLADG